MISTFTALIDANVFFGARLRSLVVELSQTGLFRARWTADIHREWTEALVAKRPDLTLPMLQKTRDLMDRAVLDCLVVGYEPLVPTLVLPDLNDCHVLAAAIVCNAGVIVTFNEKDFPDEILAPLGIHTKHPDEFLLDVEDISPSQFIEAVSNDIAHYKRPPLSVDTYLNDLIAAGVPKTAAHLALRKVLLASESDEE